MTTETFTFPPVPVKPETPEKTNPLAGPGSDTIQEKETANRIGKCVARLLKIFRLCTLKGKPRKEQNNKCDSITI